MIKSNGTDNDEKDNIWNYDNEEWFSNRVYVNNHYNENIHNNTHCVKSVQIRSFFWSAFSRIPPF